jgi:soluble lytic murein transglycosylase-like protein
MSDRLLLLVGALAGAFALMHKRVLAGQADPIALEHVRNLADAAVRHWGFRVPPEMLVRIAWIESHFDAGAVRPEPRIGDASAGLMQTLLSTARWLAKDMGYTAFGVPTLETLMGPQESLYFGGAYLDYLSRYRGERRSEEWIVRSYNGGPGHSRAATDAYWRKYLAAKAEVG